MTLSISLNLSKDTFPKTHNDVQRVKWERSSRVIQSWIVNSVSQEIGVSLVHVSDSVQACVELELMYATSNGPRIYAPKGRDSKLETKRKSVARYYARLSTF